MAKDTTKERKANFGHKHGDNLEWVDIAKLIPNERNTKRHPERQIKLLKKEIESVGFTQPILISKDNVIIGGHARLKASIELNLDEVPCRRLDLTYQEILAVGLADNKLGELAEWDYPIVEETILELKADPSFDMELTGFTEEETEKLLMGVNFDDIDPESKPREKKEDEKVSVVAITVACPTCGSDIDLDADGQIVQVRSKVKQGENPDL